MRGFAHRIAVRLEQSRLVFLHKAAPPLPPVTSRDERSCALRDEDDGSRRVLQPDPDR